MKIKQEHYQVMSDAINKYLDDNPNIESTYTPTDILARPITIASLAGLTRFICGTVYKYCDDTHINTAYKKIIKLRYGSKRNLV